MSPRTAAATKTPPAVKAPGARAPRPKTQPAVTVERKLLLDALARVAPAMAPRNCSVQTIAGTVLIEAARGRLTLRATNLDLHLATWVDADTSASFKAVVSAETLTKLVRWADGPIRITPTAANSDHQVAVTFGRTQAQLYSFNPADWPETPEIHDGRSVHLTAADVAMIRRLVPFASPDDARPILTAILLEGHDVVATDSYRLAVGTVDTDLGDASLFPARAARFLPARMLDGETVAVTVGDRKFAWEFDRLAVVTNRIDGEFPNYRQLMPGSVPTGYTVNRADMIMACKRTGAVVRTGDPEPARLHLDGGDLVITVSHPQRGVIVERVPATVLGDPPEIGFNPRYLKDCLAALTGELATIGVIDSLRPAVMAEPGFTSLLMPVRVR